MITVDNQPDWLAPPPPDAVAVVLDAAEAAAHGDEGQACAVLTDSQVHRGWLRISAVGLLASLLRRRVVEPDTLRAEVLRVASATGATDYIVDAALEAVALAEALQRGDLSTVETICHASVVAAFDHAHSAAAVAGQTVAALAGDDPPLISAMFDRIRAGMDGQP